jgi:hypothetical protein
VNWLIDYENSYLHGMICLTGYVCCWLLDVGQQRWQRSPSSVGATHLVDLKVGQQDNTVFAESLLLCSCL